MKNKQRNKKTCDFLYPEGPKIRETLSLICKLVPDFKIPIDLESEILEPLKNAEWYTRKQAFAFWDIYAVLLEQLTARSLTAAAFFLATLDEDKALDYWAGVMDRLLNDIYLVFTQSSFESFLERYRTQVGKTTYETL